MKLLMIFLIISALVNSSTGQAEESVTCETFGLCGSSEDQTPPETMTKEECSQFDKSRLCYRSSLEDCRTKEYSGKEEDIALREENMKKLDATYDAKCGEAANTPSANTTADTTANTTSNSTSSTNSNSLTVPPPIVNPGTQAECLTPELKPCEGYAVQETPETMTSEQCRSLEEDKNCHHQLLLACGRQSYTGKDEDMVNRERKQMQLENDYIAKCTKMTPSGASATTLSAICVLLCGFVSLLF